MRKSILFLRPDYHCSFVYRDELRKLGWRADVFVPDNYPKNLLFSNKDIIRFPKRMSGLDSSKLFRWLSKKWFFIVLSFWVIRRVFSYQYLFFYGGLGGIPLLLRNKSPHEPQVSLTLGIAKFLGIKLIQLPSGCLEEETKENFSKLDGGNVCGNCGWGPEVCNDEKNVARFDLVRRYADMVVGTGSHDSSQLKMTHFKYKSLDLDQWKPGLEIPSKHCLPETDNLRILHAFSANNRDHGGKNIKGSPFIAVAIDRLKDEGYPVEYMHLTDVPSREMRYYQVQADIVVEQLIYGWWGSTGVETMAMGKPVVCYMRESWKELFFKTFPEYTDLPIVEANVQTIYKVLKKLVEDKDYRERTGRDARLFAEQHFDVKKNAKSLAKLLEQL